MELMEPSPLDPPLEWSLESKTPRADPGLLGKVRQAEVGDVIHASGLPT
jgi:hypothetical protein